MKKKYIGDCPKCLKVEIHLVNNKICRRCYLLYYPKDPKKQKAREILQSRVASGTIKRLPCQFCGNPNGDAHHENYSKPLDVVWVCRKHHGMIHRGILKVS